MMKVKKFLVFEIIDRLFWLFIMLFPIVGYLVYLPSVKSSAVADGDFTGAVPEKEYVYYDMGDYGIDFSWDLSGAIIVFCSYVDVNNPNIPWNSSFLSSTGGYSINCFLSPPEIYLSKNDLYVTSLGLIPDSIVSEYELPLDFGSVLPGNCNFMASMILISGVKIPVESEVPIVADTTQELPVNNSPLSFSDFWGKKLDLMPLTDNVVGNSLCKLFEKGANFFDFFENSSVFVSILLWIIAVEFAHFFVDFVLFLPRFVHNLLEKYTYGG